MHPAATQSGLASHLAYMGRSCCRQQASSQSVVCQQCVSKIQLLCWTSLLCVHASVRKCSWILKCVTSCSCLHWMFESCVAEVCMMILLWTITHSEVKSCTSNRQSESERVTSDGATVHLTASCKLLTHCLNVSTGMHPQSFLPAGSLSLTSQPGAEFCCSLQQLFSRIPNCCSCKQRQPV